MNGQALKFLNRLTVKYTSYVTTATATGSRDVQGKFEDVVESLTFFAFVAITALCLCFTFSVIVYSMGFPSDPQNFIVANLFIASCVAVPTAAIAAQHEYRMRIYQRMSRTEMTSAVALFDIDYFKAVNDQHGHAAGDRVLREIAAVAYSELRGPFDRLGRWGGEEFVVLLSNVDMEKALSVCDRLRSSIEDHVVIVDGQPVSVTASFGLAMLPPNSDFDDMLEQADGALYESKAKGRNCVTAVKELTLAA